MLINTYIERDYMKTLKCTVLSDLHLDHWFGHDMAPNLKRVYNVFKPFLDESEDVPVLIVAGDISDFVGHIRLLEEIAIMFNYKKVFAVLGNHDIYIVDVIGHKQYPDTSIKKQEAWYNTPSDIVTIFNGTSELYEGVKFGGAMSWYDATYRRPQGATRETIDRAWRNNMMDSHYLPRYKDLFEIFDQELPKVKAVLDCDVIITHICPVSARIGIVPGYKESNVSTFYCFDGEKLVDESNASHWIFGHSHGYHAFNIYDTEIIMNTLGYPSEKRISQGPVNIEITV